MALPEKFSSTEHLQDTIKRVVNKRVREHFRDVHDEAKSTQPYEPDIGTGRGALRVACTHLENDSSLETLSRLLLFNIEIGSVFDGIAKVYGVPADNYHAVGFVPQITFNFQEKYELAEKAKRTPKRYQISMRLTEETTGTITQANINTWTNRIETNFPKSFTYKTGREKISYYHPEKGYRLILSAYSLPEAKKVINKILAIRGHEPEWDLLSKSNKPEKNFDKENYVTVLGKRKKTPKVRVITECFLKSVELQVHGNLDSIFLYRRFV